MDWASGHYRQSSDKGNMPDGIYYPERIAKLGAEIYRRSEHTLIPDPAELARIDPKWLLTLYTLDDLIEQAKPDER